MIISDGEDMNADENIDDGASPSPIPDSKLPGVSVASYASLLTFL
jgi:hypothetical protein